MVQRINLIFWLALMAKDHGSGGWCWSLGARILIILSTCNVCGAEEGLGWPLPGSAGNAGKPRPAQTHPSLREVDRVRVRVKIQRTGSNENISGDPWWGVRMHALASHGLIKHYYLKFPAFGISHFPLNCSIDIFVWKFISENGKFLDVAVPPKVV